MNQQRVTQILQAALDASVNGILITDNTLPDNPIVFVNPGFEAMTGYNSGEIIGRNCRFLQGEDTKQADVTRMREAIAAGEALHLELRNYRKDGTPFWNDLTISPVKNQQGRVTHFIGVQNDVTDRKEKSVAQSKQLMAENVVDTVREPLLILNENLTVYSANLSFYRFFETTPAEIIGQHVYELEDGYLNIPALKTLIENILPQKNPFENFEITHDFARVGRKTLLLNARRVERNEERPEFIMLAMEDLTPYRQSENARLESERRSRFIVDGLRGVAVITTDNRGNISTWNSGAEQMIGWSEEEIVGSNLTLLFNPDSVDSGAAEAEVRAAVEHGQVQSERWIKRKDGSKLWAMSILAARHDEDGHFQGFAQLIHDQTERKMLEEELARRADELMARDSAKDQFLAMLGHELRNPLAAIGNAASVAQMLSNQESLKRPLEIANRQVDNMNRLVSDLLDVARVTQGKIALQNERLNFSEIVSAVVKSLQRQADTKGLAFDFSIEPDVFVHGDALRLEQIASNLIVNAIKYTARGFVRVRVQKRGGQARFEVEDSGVGIDPELLPRLFELFSQAHRSLARSEGGLGVGLTIVKQLVDLHGGGVEAHSEGENRGSRFEVTLPLDLSAAPLPSDSAEEIAKNDGKMTVLVVEDNPDIAEMMTLTLQLWNYRTFSASDGETALQTALEVRPDIVLLDIGLPGLDGYEVARRIRQKHGPETMKLISLTGYAQQSDTERAKEAGFDKHLAKPVELSTLQEVLSGYELEKAQG